MITLKVIAPVTLGVGKKTRIPNLNRKTQIYIQSKMLIYLINFVGWYECFDPQYIIKQI